MPTAVTIGFNETTYNVTEGEDDVATVFVAVLEGELRRRVSVTFSTEVLGSDNATGESFVVDALITVKKSMQCMTCTNHRRRKQGGRGGHVPPQIFRGGGTVGHRFTRA